MTRFEDLDTDIQNKFTDNNIIPVSNNYFTPNLYKNLIVQNWNTIISTYINNFTRGNIFE